MTQWHTQAGSITTNIKVKIDFALPKISTTKIVSWNRHMDVSAKDRYDMILVRYILLALGLNFLLSDHAIESYDANFKGSTSPTVDLGAHEFNYLNTGKIKSEEVFMNAYAEEIHKSEQVRTSTRRLRAILDDKYEKSDLNKVM